MAALRRTRRAARDLLEIWRHIAEHNPGAAEIAAGLGCFPVGRYVLLYREMAGGMEIVRCVHGARDPFALALPKGEGG